MNQFLDLSGNECYGTCVDTGACQGRNNAAENTECLSDVVRQAPPENRRVCGQKPTPTFTNCIKKYKEVQLTNSSKDIRISFHVSEAEYQQIEAKANKAGMSISANVRTASLRQWTG